MAVSAPIQELGLEGLDIVQEATTFATGGTPYADYDCLNTLKSAIELAHLNTVPNEGYWTKLVASNACRAMFPGVGASSSSSSSTLKSIGAIGPNYRANFVLFPSSRGSPSSSRAPNTTASSFARHTRLYRFSRAPVASTRSWTTCLNAKPTRLLYS